MCPSSYCLIVVHPCSDLHKMLKSRNNKEGHIFRKAEFSLKYRLGLKILQGLMSPVLKLEAEFQTKTILTEVY